MQNDKSVSLEKTGGIPSPIGHADGNQVATVTTLRYLFADWPTPVVYNSESFLGPNGQLPTPPFVLEIQWPTIVLRTRIALLPLLTSVILIIQYSAGLCLRVRANIVQWTPLSFHQLEMQGMRMHTTVIRFHPSSTKKKNHSPEIKPSNE